MLFKRFTKQAEEDLERLTEQTHTVRDRPVLSFSFSKINSAECFRFEFSKRVDFEHSSGLTLHETQFSALPTSCNIVSWNQAG